jgi:hypothetical protein
MPYSPHVKVVWGGTTVDEEVWACSLSVATTPVATITEVPVALRTAITTFHTSTATFITPACTLDYIKANSVNALGKYVLPVTNEWRPAAPIAGGAVSSCRMPLSVGFKMSLDDGSRDRRAKGGFYTPWASVQLDASGTLDLTQQDNLNLQVKTLVDDINAIPDWTVVVASGVSGGLAAVTRVRVGQVPDVQRRRRNKQPENYFTRVVTP